MEKNRIRKSVIDDYCFYSGNGSSWNLSWDDKIQLVNDKIADLKRIEWQRWLPVVGLVRRVRDNINESQTLLNEIHSRQYEHINILYNVAVVTGALAAELLKYAR